MLLKPEGVFGGTFDPIHYGHLAVAEYLSAYGQLMKIHFVPCLAPPHRNPPQASPQQRLAMVRLAIASHPGWVADDIDFHRPGPSYMVDTLALLHERQPQTPWCLLLGMDAFLHFNKWRDWRKILTLAHLVIINRPEFILPKTGWIQRLLQQHQIYDPKHLHHTLAGGILLADMPPSVFSATAIRSRSVADWEQALPAPVLQYVREHHLYLR